MLRYGSSRRLAWVALALPACLPTLAAAQLDTPGLELVRADRSSITVRVIAGPSGAPAGFEVQWMTRANYDLLAGWPADEYDPAIRSCEFVGVPTLTTTPGVTSFALEPNAAADVEPGDLFDETGVATYYADELPSGVAFVLRAEARGTATVPESGFSTTLFTSTNPTTDCVLTQGFWKNHAGAWPVASLTLGTVLYTQAQLLDILDTPATGNGLIFLAHQLIATKLNIASGADATPIAATIAAADALIDGLVIPPVGAGFLAPSDASPLTDTLDSYNNGGLGVPHCDAIAVQAQTWSALKGLYR